MALMYIVRVPGVLTTFCISNSAQCSSWVHRDYYHIRFSIRSAIAYVQLWVHADEFQGTPCFLQGTHITTLPLQEAAHFSLVAPNGTVVDDPIYKAWIMQNATRNHCIPRRL